MTFADQLGIEQPVPELDTRTVILFRHLKNTNIIARKLNCHARDLRSNLFHPFQFAGGTGKVYMVASIVFLCKTQQFPDQITVFSVLLQVNIERQFVGEMLKNLTRCAE